MQIEKAECGEDERQDHTSHDVAIAAGHLSLPGERDITFGE
jgi:hypothetical protein